MAYLLGSMGLSANVVVQWILEVAHFCLGVPMLLVGCKQDLRHCPRVIDQLKRTNQRPVTLEEVRHDRRSSWETVLTKARVGFGSVSGDRGRVLFREVFNYAARAALLRPGISKTGKCLVL